MSSEHFCLESVRVFFCFRYKKRNCILTYTHLSRANFDTKETAIKPSQNRIHENPTMLQERSISVKLQKEEENTSCVSQNTIFRLS